MELLIEDPHKHKEKEREKETKKKKRKRDKEKSWNTFFFKFRQALSKIYFKTLFECSFQHRKYLKILENGFLNQTFEMDKNKID